MKTISILFLVAATTASAYFFTRGNKEQRIARKNTKKETEAEIIKN